MRKTSRDNSISQTARSKPTPKKIPRNSNNKPKFDMDKYKKRVTIKMPNVEVPEKFLKKKPIEKSTSKINRRSKSQLNKNKENNNRSKSQLNLSKNKKKSNFNKKKNTENKKNDKNFNKLEDNNSSKKSQIKFSKDISEIKEKKDNSKSLVSEVSSSINLTELMKEEDTLNNDPDLSQEKDKNKLSLNIANIKSSRKNQNTQRSKSLHPVSDSSEEDENDSVEKISKKPGANKLASKVRRMTISLKLTNLADDKKKNSFDFKPTVKKKVMSNKEKSNLKKEELLKKIKMEEEQLKKEQELVSHITSSRFNSAQSQAFKEIVEEDLMSEIDIEESEQIIEETNRDKNGDQDLPDAIIGPDDLIEEFKPFEINFNQINEPKNALFSNKAQIDIPDNFEIDIKTCEYNFYDLNLGKKEKLKFDNLNEIRELAGLEKESIPEESDEKDQEDEKKEEDQEEKCITKNESKNGEEDIIIDDQEDIDEDENEKEILSSNFETNKKEKMDNPKKNISRNDSIAMSINSDDLLDSEFDDEEEDFDIDSVNFDPNNADESLVNGSSDQEEQDYQDKIYKASNVDNNFKSQENLLNKESSDSENKIRKFYPSNYTNKSGYVGDSMMYETESPA